MRRTDFTSSLKFNLENDKVIHDVFLLAVQVYKKTFSASWETLYDTIFYAYFIFISGGP